MKSINAIKLRIIFIKYINTNAEIIIILRCWRMPVGLNIVPMKITHMWHDKENSQEQTCSTYFLPMNVAFLTAIKPKFFEN